MSRLNSLQDQALTEYALANSAGQDLRYNGDVSKQLEKYRTLFHHLNQAVTLFAQAMTTLNIPGNRASLTYGDALNRLESARERIRELEHEVNAIAIGRYLAELHGFRES